MSLNTTHFDPTAVLGLYSRKNDDESMSFMLARGSVAVLFRSDGENIRVQQVSTPDTPDYGFGDEYDGPWIRATLSESLINLFLIKIEWFLLYQKEFEYLGFQMPKPVVKFVGV